MGGTEDMQAQHNDSAALAWQDDQLVAAATASFHKFDADESGGIDATELRHALTDAGLVVSEQQSEYVLRKYLVEDTEALDLPSFIKVCRDVHSNLLQKLLNDRIALRTHPHVQSALEQWWAAAMHNSAISEEEQPAEQTRNRTTSKEVLAAKLNSKDGGNSLKRAGKCSRRQYAAILKRIFKAMQGDYDDEVATATAEAESTADCAGRESLEAQRMQDGIFEIADRWCSSVDGEAYGDFLLDLLSQVTQKEPVEEATQTSHCDEQGAGQYIWKSIMDIEHGGYSEDTIVEKVPLQRDALTRHRQSVMMERRRSVEFEHIQEKLAARMKEQESRKALEQERRRSKEADKRRSKEIEVQKKEEEERRKQEEAKKAEAHKTAMKEAAIQQKKVELARKAEEQAKAQALAKEQQTAAEEARQARENAKAKSLADRMEAVRAKALLKEEEAKKAQESLAAAEQAAEARRQAPRMSLTERAEADKAEAVEREMLARARFEAEEKAKAEAAAQKASLLAKAKAEAAAQAKAEAEARKREAEEREAEEAAKAKQEAHARSSLRARLEAQMRANLGIKEPAPASMLGGNDEQRSTSHGPTWKPTQSGQSDALWNQIAYGDTDVAGQVQSMRTGATSMVGGYSNALRESKSGYLIDHGEYQSNRFEDRVLNKDRRNLGGWRPTQHNGDALWHETAYGDTDVAGAVKHKYRGADERTGATSMVGGYSNALRESKNGYLIDHGEYQSNRFEDRVLNKDRRNLGGWRPTQHNGDALWHEISYGDTCVPGKVQDIRNMPKMEGGTKRTNGSLLLSPRPVAIMLHPIEVPMTRYEDKQLDDTWDAGRESNVSGALSNFPNRPAALNKAMGSGKKHDLPSVPTTPRQSEIVPTAPSTAISRARTALAPTPQHSTRPVTALSIGADLHQWKPLIAKPMTAAIGAGALESASSEPLPRRAQSMNPSSALSRNRRCSEPLISTPPHLRPDAEPVARDDASQSSQSFSARPRVPHPPAPRYLRRSIAAIHDDDGRAQSFPSHAQRRAALPEPYATVEGTGSKDLRSKSSEL